MDSLFQGGPLFQGCLPFQRCISPGLRVIDLLEAFHGDIHGPVVHGDDLLSLLAVRLCNGVLEKGDSLVHWEDIRELEEGGLHDHVDPSPEPDLTCDPDRIDGVEPELLLRNDPLHASRKVGFHLGEVPG